jgi:hypothetical protein
MNHEVFGTFALSVYTEVLPPLDFDIHFRVFPRTRYLLISEKGHRMRFPPLQRFPEIVP